MLSEHDRLKYQQDEPRLPEQVAEGTIISPDTRRANRVPPGQTRTRKWPILQYGGIPEVSTAEWELTIVGLVDRPQRFTWDEFRALPRVRVYSDFHCVTTWSRLDNVWEGVSTRELLNRAGVKADSRFAILHGYDNGFTTNLPLGDFLAEDALLADTHDGVAINADHGGPVRAVVPQLYAWKSAKWIRSIELTDHNEPGYWERAGYHNHGDPWTEERFGG